MMERKAPACFAALQLSSLLLAPAPLPRSHPVRATGVHSGAWVVPAGGMLGVMRAPPCDRRPPPLLLARGSADASGTASAGPGHLGAAYSGPVGANATLQICLDDAAMQGDCWVKLVNTSHPDAARHTVEVESFSFTQGAMPASSGDATFVMDIADRGVSILARLSALAPAGTPALTLHRVHDDALVFVVERANRDRSHVVIEAVKLARVRAQSAHRQAKDAAGDVWRLATQFAPVRSGIVPTTAALGVGGRRRRKVLHTGLHSYRVAARAP